MRLQALKRQPKRFTIVFMPLPDFGDERRIGRKVIELLGG